MNYWIGCSGWQYPEWAGKFYPVGLPKSRWLSFYMQHFSTVEINYSFYRFPLASTVQKWYQQAPTNFLYTLKMPRVITHYQKFHNTEQLLQDFYQLSDLLQEKLGCLLLQFPASVVYDALLLERMLKQLDTRKKHVIEFRHPSWWQESVYQKLAAANIAFCSVSAPKLPKDLITIHSTFYCRLHGKSRWYCDSYSNEDLQQLYLALAKTSVREAWIYFDNSMTGDAPINAQQLIELCKK